jgi:hypothetical protein
MRTRTEVEVRDGDDGTIHGDGVEGARGRVRRGDDPLAPHLF